MISNAWTMCPHFLVVLVLITSGCAGGVTQSPLGRAQVLALTDQELNERGEKAFERFKGQSSIEADDAVNRYVGCVFRALIAEAKDPTGISKWEIVVFRSNTADVSSWPGGKVAVTTGMLSVARTPGQLAAALGVSISSLIARHPNERASTEFRSRVSSSMVAAVLGTSNPSDRSTPTSTDPVLRLEADTLGQLLMARAGFNPEESLRLWEDMHRYGGASESLSTVQRRENLQNNLPESMKLYEAAKRAGKVPACTAPA